MEVFEVEVVVVPFAVFPVPGDDAGIEDAFADFKDGEGEALEGDMGVCHWIVSPVTWTTRVGFAEKTWGVRTRGISRQRTGCDTSLVCAR